MAKKEKKAKPVTEKKARKVRAKMRSRKDSPAGHFADRLAANVKQFNDIMTAVAGWPGVTEATSAAEKFAVLNELAEKNFVPARKNSGRKALAYVAGQKVALSPEALAMVKQLFTAAGVTDESAFFVSDGYVAAPKDTQLPIRLGSSELTAPPVGFITKKWIAAAPQVSA